MSGLMIRKVAVLGAGVMGAQIAAHIANAGIAVILFDLAAKEGSPNTIVERALAGLKKLKPAPLGARDVIHHITAANYETDLALLSDCDLIIEAIAEKMAWKADLYQKIAPYLNAHAVIASNTSGLSIQALSENVPTSCRSRFCGIHFFNPPRYMTLVEIIPCATTEEAVTNHLEAWLTQQLGKGVIRAFDTPNFVANRIGVAWLLIVAHHAQRLGLPFDEVDALTGELIGLPKSATFRLSDIVGLDTLSHVVNGMASHLKDDPWLELYQVADWAKTLIERGALGAKTAGKGIYQKEGKTFKVFDVILDDYRDVSATVDAQVLDILKIKEPWAKWQALRTSTHPQAQLIWAIHRDLFHYCAHHLGDIAASAREVDFAMRWGYGWKQGPFELWQQAGWSNLTQCLAEDIASGAAYSQHPLPDWVHQVTQIHTPEGSFSPRQQGSVPRSTLPVYQRQLFPELLLGESANWGRTVFETEGVRLWVRDDVDADIGILSFKTRMHVVSQAVLTGIIEAVGFAEKQLKGLVVWHGAPFALGADLKEVLLFLQKKEGIAFAPNVELFQNACLALKYASIPTVAGVSGMALGGGCEVALYSGKRVVAFESYMGLVEAGVGLIPAGGGSAYFARLASERLSQTTNKDLFAILQPFFMAIAQAKTSTSALNAREMGYLNEGDTIVMNPQEVLFVAIKQARAAYEMGHKAPLPPCQIVVAGKAGIANAEQLLVNMRDGGFISAYDYQVAKAAAIALCGGEIEGGSVVDEAWILRVEREQFVQLLMSPLTHARMKHTMETGKPLRN